MPIDFYITETDGNGGDLQFANNDIVPVYGLENNIYLALFGGNVEQSTGSQDRILPINVQNSPLVNQQNFDFWGNSLLLSNDKTQYFNSQTERVLNSTQLSSVGRVKIENAMKEDLSFLSSNGIVTVDVTIISDDKINAIIKLVLNDNDVVIEINLIRTISGDWFIEDFNNDFFL